MDTGKQKRVAVIAVAICLLVGIGLYAGYRSHNSLQVVERFNQACESKDYSLAQRLWDQGRVPATGAYGRFMLIRDRIDAVSGVTVTDWQIGELQSLNGANRYYALIDIEDDAARFGVGLEWRSNRWELKETMAELPKYVVDSLSSDRVDRTSDDNR